ncbi:MAG: hypothetical protein IPK08_19770 [Bacteroidetes bacterium]|nr:hypothetical protein [Bacteroidota bacterium]
MKIAAAYLRKIDPAELDNTIYNPGSTGTNTLPLIEAVEVVEDSKNNLGYKIYLLKPKHLLIIDVEKKCNIQENLIKDLRSYGIWYVHELGNDFFYQSYGHEYMLVVNPNVDILNKMKENEKKLPLRKFISGNSHNHCEFINIDFKFDNLNKINDETAAKGFLSDFWQNGQKVSVPTSQLIAWQ